MKNNVSWDDALKMLMQDNPDQQEELQEDVMMAQLIAQITRARIDAGLSQRQLADRCDVKQSVIARMETAQAVPRLDTVVKVINRLGLELDLREKPIKQNKIISICGYSWNQDSIRSAQKRNKLEEVIRDGCTA